jgi:nicotinic acid mononucleotide adenylyltransferase
MDLVQRGARDARRVAMLPAAWNPPTLAHVALAEAALDFSDEVLLVLPRLFPHKEFDEAGFGVRLDWLRLIASSRAGLGVGVAEGGLFLEMARALRATDPQVEQVYIVCGRDAAERFLDWPYDREPDAIGQLREFSLLVAPRGGPLTPSALLRGSILTLKLDPKLSGISSTEIRERIRRGEPWTHLVPNEIVREVEGIYR